MLQRLTGLGVGKTSSLIQWIADGSLSLEKPVDEVVLVYSQAQPLYMELAAAVAVVKLVRLEDSLSLEDFLRLVGTDRRPVRALIFDDVEGASKSGIWRILLESFTRLAHHLNCFVFFTTHQLFVERNEYRVVQRSAVRVLARRCFPDHPEVLTAAFDRLLREPESASYVLLDLRPRLGNEALRVRHSFRLDAPLVAYQPADPAEPASQDKGPSGPTAKRRP